MCNKNTSFFNFIILNTTFYRLYSIVLTERSSIYALVNVRPKMATTKVVILPRCPYISIRFATYKVS